MVERRRLMAVLEADVVGFSRMVAHDEHATSKLLARSRTQFERCALQMHGRIVNQTGDAFLLTFDSALHAVQAAREIQHLHKKQPHTRRGRMRIHFRMGIEMGDVWEDQSGQPVGNAVNTATRLEALADPGGLCVSAAVHAQVYNRVDLSFTDHGEHALKNIPFPVRVFRASVYTPPAEDPALSSGSGGRAMAFARSFGRGGAAASAAAAPAPHRGASPIPSLGKNPDEAAWNHFMGTAFQAIQQHFQKNLKLLKSRSDGVKTEFQQGRDGVFICRVLAGGRMLSQAKIWLGTAAGNGQQIYYSNHDLGLKSDHSWNISLNPARNRETLALWAVGSPLGPHHGDFDLECLAPGDAAEFFWRMFIHPMHA